MNRSTPEPDVDRIAAEFLLRMRADEETAGRRPLAVYLACYPGHEEIVAREFVAAAAAPGERAVVALAPGHHVGRFRLDRLLGRGGQGEVWLAHDGSLRRTVALKVLHAPGALARLRFLREAFLAGRLDHPGIGAVHDTGDDDGRVWVAMQHVPGRSLQQELAAAPSGLPHSRAVAIVADVAQALAAAHASGLVHRDVKPSNVVLGPHGPVLLDFGLAHDTRGELATVSEPGSFCGTPAYMAPEQLAGDGRIDGRVDVFALGVVLHECLTGRRPFQAPTREGLCHAILQLDPEPGRGWSRDLRAVVAMALRKDRDRRYASAAEFAADLRALLAGQPVRARSPGPLGRAWTWARRRPVAAAVLVAMVVLPGIGLSWTQYYLQREAALRQRLETAFAEVRGIARTLAFEVADGLRSVPGSTRVRHLVLERAHELLARLEQQAPGDPRLQAELMMALVRLGDVLGHDGIENVGDPAAAMRCYAQARALALGLWSQADGDPARIGSLLGTFLHHADAVAVTDRAAALAAYDDVERRLAPALDRWPADAVLLRIAATIDLHVGNLLDHGGDLPGAVARHRRGVARLAALANATPAAADTEAMHAQMLAALGRSLLRGGDVVGGIDTMREGLRRLGGTTPARPSWSAAWAQAALFLGSVLYERGDLDAGRSLLDAVVAERQRACERKDGDARSGAQLASVLYERGRLRGADGVADVRAALALCERPEVGAGGRRGLRPLGCHCHLFLAFATAGDEATSHLDHARDGLDELAADHPDHPELPALRQLLTQVTAAVAAR